MAEKAVKQIKGFSGELKVPGDKSVSHRAVMLGAIATGVTTVSGFLAAEDCLSTIECFRALGIAITRNDDRVTVNGGGSVLAPPEGLLDAGNSGTTARLIMGILSGQPFTSRLTGDESLCRRPMRRVTEPLKMMGADFPGAEKEGFLPLTINGGELKPCHYKLPVASAQVKSAILLAGLYARGTTTVTEPAPTRDHTERMLETFGVEVTRGPAADQAARGRNISITGPVSLKGGHVDVPGDISSAAFFMVAAAIIPGARVVIRDVGVNPTRTGIITVLREMGAKVTLTNEKMYGSEPVADIEVEGPRELLAVETGGDIIPALIDEIPVLAVAALKARGTTVISGAGELRVKESDRISALVGELAKLQGRIEEKPDGMVIHGGHPLCGATCHSHGDHRLAMALAIAGLTATGETTVTGAECINISFPSFFTDLQKTSITTTPA